MGAMSKRERKIDLSGGQVIAGVLATLTAAIATSYVSRWGTLVAAAVVSAISTAGTAIYRYYISRTGEKLRSAAPVVRQRVNIYGAGLNRRSNAGRGAGQPQDPRSAGHAFPSGHGPVGPGGGADAVTEKLPALGNRGGADDGTGMTGLDGQDEPARSPWRSHWLTLALVAAGIFATVIVGITVIEITAGKSLSALIWHKGGSGTTVGSVVDGGNKNPVSPTPTPTPTSVQTTSPSPTPTPTSSSVPAQTPSVGATPTVPATAPGTAPPTPTATPTAPSTTSGRSPALPSSAPSP
jgi:hypothetical protein